MSGSPKILVIDIETKPALAYVWGLFDQNISIQQLVEPSAPICFAAKWIGQKKVLFHSDWNDGHKGMIEACHDLLSEADAVVGYNSDKFDLPKLMGEFLLAGLPPPPPITSIDLYKTVKKFGFQSSKLAYVGPLLEIGSKIKHAGFELWTRVEAGEPSAFKEMEQYNRQDVVLTEQLYETILPYIPNHPHLGDTHGDCGACGSSHLQSRGFRRTKMFKTQRLQCVDCGSWSTGARQGV